MTSAQRDMRPSRHLAVPSALLLLLLLLLAAAVPAARAQEETEDEGDFSYVPGAPNGPERWGTIKKKWADCGTGRMQSPIDVSDKRVTLVPALGYLNQSYRPAEASIVNRGHDIMVRFSGDAGSVTINGTAYFLRQLHWHTPSEHTVNGRRFDMELHLVHHSAANRTAVVGALYAVGPSDDAFLRELEPFLERIADRRDREEPVGVVDPRGAASSRGCDVYYRYMGSLTTPPCTEGVVWTIVRKVRTVSKRQIELLREAVHDGMEDNARPIQDLNNRDVSVFKPTPRKHY